MVVRGRVQGVCYRMSAQQEAVRHGLDGWVRNCSDGSVELLAVGTPELLVQFRAWCERGPVAACVDRMDASEWPEPVHRDGFHIRWS
jgi:acylphosphatase